MRQHMHEVRYNMIEQALVVGNDQDSPVWRTQLIDPIGHHFQGINVET